MGGVMLRCKLGTVGKGGEALDTPT